MSELVEATSNLVETIPSVVTVVNSASNAPIVFESNLVTVEAVVKLADFVSNIGDRGDHANRGVTGICTVRRYSVVDLAGILLC